MRGGGGVRGEERGRSMRDPGKRGGQGSEKRDLICFCCCVVESIDNLLIIMRI